MKKIILLVSTLFLFGFDIPTIDDFRNPERLNEVNQQIEEYRNESADPDRYHSDAVYNLLIEGLESEKETLLELGKDYKNYMYDDLARYANNKKGELILVRGKILQKTYDGLHWHIRLATEITNEENNLPQYGNDNVYLLKSDSESIDYLLEEDIVDIFGTIMGKQKYETVLGSEKELPLITTKYIWPVFEYMD